MRNVLRYAAGLRDPSKRRALKFILHGRKLEGAWAPVRMRGKDGDRPRHQKENWLLITARDTLARAKPRAR